jgi:hypothetical protein
MRLMITCEEATDWISRREEGKLTRSRRRLLRFHLFLCVWCRRFNRHNKLITHRHEHPNEDAAFSQEEKIALADRLRGLS